MHPTVIDWTREQIASWGPTAPLRVMEVGSYDVNGSVRPLFANVERYEGIDIVGGPGVDTIYDGLTIPSPDRSWDVVVSTEMLEHCARPWRVVAEMARVVKLGGKVLITARGWVRTDDIGNVACFGFHNPPDLWRYSGDALAELVTDAGLTVDSVTQDSLVAGWFVAAHL